MQISSKKMWKNKDSLSHWGDIIAIPCFFTNLLVFSENAE